MRLWRALPTANRRWIALNALAITAVINLVVNAGIAWLSVRGTGPVPLWSTPLIGGPSTITDTVGTLFLLPLITCVLVTTVVWHDLTARTISRISGPPGFLALLANLPGGRLLRGLVFGALCTAVLAPIAVAVLIATDFSGLSTWQFVAYKAALGVALGAVVTPFIALYAMTDTRLGLAGR